MSKSNVDAVHRAQIQREHSQSRVLQRATQCMGGINELGDLLRSTKGRRPVYVPNYGNAGDSFIAHATYRYLSKIGLDYEIGDASGIYPDRVVIYGGGGNLVRFYDNAADFLNRNLNRWRQLIVLPHTIRAHESLLSQLQSNSFLFCRESPSLEFAKQNAPKANVFLSHDMALSCDLDELRETTAYSILKHSVRSRLVFRDVLRLARANAYVMKSLRSQSVLNCFRTDVETIGNPPPPMNIDLSREFHAEDLSPMASLRATWFLMRFIERFRVIRTDRLHMAIMAAMLGKTVQMFDNSYGKNYDVSMHSLERRYPNIRWNESWTER